MTGTSDQLREALVRRIREVGGARREAVHRALSVVPRHLFVPEVPLEVAYAAGRAVVTKRDPRGAPLSSASAPGVVAAMLDQLDVRPGDRVLEIGSGTGYNAALLAELTGPSGRVVTVDIDPECASRAAAALARTGHPEVEVRIGDGALGSGEGSEFDRIIVTTGAWDIPPAWFDQLAVHGRLVVPLRWRRQSQSVAFVREDGRLRSDGLTMASFIPMGAPAGEHVHVVGQLDGKPVALIREDDQAVDPDALHGILERSADVAWSGVTVAPAEPFHTAWLRLTTDPRTCWIQSPRPIPAPERGSLPVNGPTLVEGRSLAFLTHRRLDDGRGVHAELGAVGLGSSGAALAGVIVRHLHAWDADRQLLPQITAYPAATPDHLLPEGAVIDKHHIRLVISRYPVAA